MTSDHLEATGAGLALHIPWETSDRLEATGVALALHILWGTSDHLEGTGVALALHILWGTLGHQDGMEPDRTTDCATKVVLRSATGVGHLAVHRTREVVRLYAMDEGHHTNVHAAREAAHLNVVGVAPGYGTEVPVCLAVGRISGHMVVPSHADSLEMSLRFELACAAPPCEDDYYAQACIDRSCSRDHHGNILPWLSAVERCRQSRQHQRHVRHREDQALLWLQALVVPWQDSSGGGGPPGHMLA